MVGVPNDTTSCGDCQKLVLFFELIVEDHYQWLLPMANSLGCANGHDAHVMMLMCRKAMRVLKANDAKCRIGMSLLAAEKQGKWCRTACCTLGAFEKETMSSAIYASDGAEDVSALAST
ncbi:unnamed protein product [Prunus armeniaca]